MLILVLYSQHHCYKVKLENTSLSKYKTNVNILKMQWKSHVFRTCKVTYGEMMTEKPMAYVCHNPVFPTLLNSCISSRELFFLTLELLLFSQLYRDTYHAIH